MHIGEARHDHLVRAVDSFGVRIAGENLRAGADGGDALAVDRDRGVIVHRIIVVDGDDGGIVNDSDQGLPLGLSRSQEFNRPVQGQYLHIAAGE